MTAFCVQLTQRANIASVTQVVNYVGNKSNI